MSEWVEIKFRDFIKLNRGFDLPNDQMIDGEYPVVASTNIKGFHNKYKINPPAVITGRSGSLGTVQYIDTKCVPLNTMPLFMEQGLSETSLILCICSTPYVKKRIQEKAELDMRR